MARPTVTVDNWTYEGVDAHRTLQHLGDLWLHHTHGRTPSPDTQQRSAEALAALFAPLAGDDDTSLAPYQRVTHLGERAAARLDELNPTALQLALREMWAPLAALRGLTSGALLGGLILALFGRGVGPRAAVAGMLTALVVMNVIYWPATIPSLREAWLRTFGGE
ncbi:MAG: hypothetical protein ACKO8V_07405, partial [Actinomycetota bacterium]